MSVVYWSWANSLLSAEMRGSIRIKPNVWWSEGRDLLLFRFATDFREVFDLDFLFVYSHCALNSTRAVSAGGGLQPA
jgi:hypothetical protein